MTSLKRNKIIYIPGLISLIFLPILCFNKLQLEEDRLKQHCIQVIWYRDKVTMANDFYLGTTIPDTSKLNFNNFTLTGNNINDIKILSEFKKNLTSASLNNNFNRGIRIIFEKKCKYNSVIKAIDLCNQNKIPSFLLVSNELLIFPKVKSSCIQPTTSPILPNIMCGTPIKVRNNETSMVPESEINYFIEYFRLLPYSAALFVLLLITSILKSTRKTSISVLENRYEAEKLN